MPGTSGGTGEGDGVKIRITRDTKIPLVDKGRIFEVFGTSNAGDGEKVYFIYHGGNCLGIRAADCEEIEPEGVTT